MTQYLFSLLLVLLTLTVNAQKERGASRSSMIWNEYYDLTWHDFEGMRTEGAIGDAGTAVQIRAKPYMVGDKVQYDVSAIFLRDKSWVSDKSDQLLIHERLHFDIAEWYARKIRKKIQELSNRGVNDVKTFNAAIQELLEESNEIDVRYDVETLHGALLKRQKSWEAKVSKELDELGQYKRQKRVISSQ